jgi:DNA topoisomerase-1
MHLIIAEKNLVAERIAAFLAGKEKVTMTRDGAANQYAFNDTVVMGLRGHVVEVDFVSGYSNWRSEEHPPRSLIDAGIEKHPTEKKIVVLLQKHAKKAERVTIATDFDTEGELIGKEAYELVRAVNRTVRIDRARFSAITKEEITKSIHEAQELDFNLAAAGETRQVIDLVWGASLTRFLSISAKRGADSILSAGRVQSPTLAMIVEREREIEAFVPETYWMLSLIARAGGTDFDCRHAHGRFTDKAAAQAAYENTTAPLIVTGVAAGSKTDKAPAPLDTTSLIVGAGRLGLSANSAMSRAEDLYMRGFISYPRTDNTVYPKSLDTKAHLNIFAGTGFGKDAAWVLDNHREKPVRGKRETTDHPPIYPTAGATREEIGDDVTWKLYEFIVRRFFATLSPDAEWKTIRITMDAGSEPYLSTGGRLLVPGWRHIYPYSRAEENILPEMSVGDRLDLMSKKADEKETQPPARYSQSRLIQRMEEFGLGTKSTRHEVIGKLSGRKYIEGNPMKPTIVGRAVTESLEKYAGEITAPAMTKTLEAHMEEIAAGTKSASSVISESRSMLSGIFDDLEAHKEAIGQELIDKTREEQTIGKCPVCGQPLRIRKRGSSQFIGCSGYPDCTFNAGLPPAAWGTAVKTSEICDIHGLNHVRLVRRGAPPWDIGCPLCAHIATNTESFMMLPGMTGELLEKLQQAHIYTISEFAAMSPDEVTGHTGISREMASALLSGAQEVLVRLRKRTELKKFVSARITPRRGRGSSKVVKALAELGIADLASLAQTDPASLAKAHLSDDEAYLLVSAARKTRGYSVMKEIGIPAVTLKKYVNRGYDDPSVLLHAHPAGIALATGVSLAKIHEHQTLAAQYLKRSPPDKLSKGEYDRITQGLSALGLEGETLAKLAAAGAFTVVRIVNADAGRLAADSGIPREDIEKIQETAKGVCTK